MPYQRALAYRLGFEPGSPGYETIALPTELSRLLFASNQRFLSSLLPSPVGPIDYTRGSRWFFVNPYHDMKNYVVSNQLLGSYKVRNFLECINKIMSGGHGLRVVQLQGRVDFERISLPAEWHDRRGGALRLWLCQRVHCKKKNCSLVIFTYFFHVEFTWKH